MNWNRLAAKARACREIMLGNGKPSFGQFGEDRILDFLFHGLGITTPTYLDIGANEPVLGSNTFYFYNRGGSGVLVEPDPALQAVLEKARPRDTLLRTGIGFSEASSAPFYVFSRKYSGWNTFNPEEAELRKRNGRSYEKVIEVPLATVNQIIERHFGKAPDLISIDVEGLDFDIVRSLDFQRFGPAALVLETLRFGDTPEERKEDALIQYVCGQGYEVFGDTYANTIFRKRSVPKRSR